MSPEQERDLVRREFKRRGKRSICQLLTDLRDKLRRNSGWTPTLENIRIMADGLGLRVKW